MKNIVINSAPEEMIRISGITEDSIVDGPCIRVTLFTQGCTRNCHGCHNVDTQPLNGGVQVPFSAIIDVIDKNPLTTGLTISGGEPMLQADKCCVIAKNAKSRGLNVWVYTGYTFEELLSSGDIDVFNFLLNTDVLVDGPYIESLRNISLPFRGSENQRIIDVQASIKHNKTILVEGMCNEKF